MFGLGSVAGLAGNDDVLAEFFLIDDVGVAAFADLVPGMGNRASGDFGNGRTAIVAILTKRAGNDDGAQEHERDQGKRHDYREADEMFDIFEQVRIQAPGVRC